MTESIQTKDNVLLHRGDKKTNCICDDFNYPLDAFSESQSLQKGLGSETLVNCGRELIVQKQIEDAGVNEC